MYQCYVLLYNLIAFQHIFSTVHKAFNFFLCFRVRGELLASLDSQETEACQESGWLDPL